MLQHGAEASQSRNWRDWLSAKLKPADPTVLGTSTKFAAPVQQVCGGQHRPLGDRDGVSRSWLGPFGGQEQQGDAQRAKSDQGPGAAACCIGAAETRRRWGCGEGEGFNGSKTPGEQAEHESGSSPASSGSARQWTMHRIADRVAASPRLWARGGHGRVLRYRPRRLHRRRG